ncbi:MAG TPA: dephospho-CoA kinase [Burkholderiaceae bacterium]|nr:dephospho-CoA kinase [Burkholderiaceae bacterium]
MPRALRLAVTGGIGSGKSTVVALLAEHGAAIIDSDAIAHELTAAGGPAIAPIREAFGPGVIDERGALDRARMRSLVFSDAQQRLRLESILHPLIRQRCLELAREREPTAPLLVFDIPLLVEATAVRKAFALDRILVVDCPTEVQLARATARGTMPPEQVRRVIASQVPRWQRIEMADDVVFNADSLDELRARVAHLWASYCPTEPVCYLAQDDDRGK